MLPGWRNCLAEEHRGGQCLRSTSTPPSPSSQRSTPRHSAANTKPRESCPKSRLLPSITLAKQARESQAAPYPSCAPNLTMASRGLATVHTGSPGHWPRDILGPGLDSVPKTLEASPEHGHFRALLLRCLFGLTRLGEQRDLARRRTRCPGAVEGEAAPRALHLGVRFRDSKVLGGVSAAPGSPQCPQHPRRARGPV